VTIKIPPENLLDKILKLIEKERKVIVPEEAEKIFRKRVHMYKLKRDGKAFGRCYFE